MPNFILKVGTPDGQIVEREVQAMNLDAARDMVAREGLHIFQARQRMSASGLLRRRRHVTIDKFLLFNQELLALVRAGLPIVQSLEIMLERQKEPTFRGILTEVRDKVRSGVALSDAFASFGSVFPSMYHTSLRAGERSGDLEGVLRRFLKYQKLISALRKKVIGALVYPSVLVVLALGMITVMLTVVIPKFSEFFEGFGAEMPAFTVFVINLSTFLRKNILLIGVGLVVAYLAFQQWARTSSGATALDRFKLRIPFVGGVFHSFSVMQFTQSLATLLGGGTPMVGAIETAAESVSNRFMSGKLGGIAQPVREGEPLWRSLDETRVIGDLAVEMIKVGESTGALVEMLLNVSEFYDEEIETKLARMIALIEPLILVVLGGVIAGLLYAFYLPLFELSKASQ